MSTVCFFNSTPFWGGGEKWHLEAALAFRERGYTVVVVGSPDAPLLERAAEAGLTTASFEITNTSWLNPLALRRLRRFFLEKNVDTVVFNGPRDIKVGGLAARSAKVRNRVYRRGLALPVRNRALNRYLFTNVLTHIVTNSEATKATLLQNLGDRVPPGRVKVIMNGIDVAAFDAHPFRPVFDPSDSGAEIVLGNVGRLTPQKGQSFLLDVARALKDEAVPFRLLIAGDGDLEDTLRERARALDVDDHVEFLGFVDDVPSFLKDIDIFLLSSLWEGFGYVIAEAGAAGRPVVAFDANSNPESIEDGRTGFLVEPGNLEQFSLRVVELIEDAKLRARMGEAARQLVTERFQLSEKIDEFERFVTS